MWLFGKKHHRSDESLAQLYFDTGDNSVFAELFEKHVRTVYGACLFYFSNKAQAEDVTMQIFEKLMVELRKTNPDNFKGWLSYVVRNYCLNEIKKQNAVRLLDVSYLEKQYSFAELEEEERRLIEKNDQLLALIDVVLPLLKPAQRNCIEAFYLKKQSYEQIAASFKITLNEVKSNIQNGKRNLKIHLEEKIKQNEKGRTSN